MNYRLLNRDTFLIRTGLIFLVVVWQLVGCAVVDDIYKGSFLETTINHYDSKLKSNQGGGLVDNSGISRRYVGAKAPVEVIWKVPIEPVDGFIIRYGFDRNTVEGEVKLRVSEIEMVRQPPHGFVYRYVLQNLPVNERIFITISSYRGDRVSRISSTFEIR
ncbi:MAG TPA: hypothetical protein PKD37_05545 [Oligoflexia bacterium]|nr:hypothetical protein [Oligoflexia bacterium]HMP27429.1 hypothetical protein [Oligoflexia bacterium]